jgi:hypothetical protein
MTAIACTDPLHVLTEAIQQWAVGADTAPDAPRIAGLIVDDPTDPRSLAVQRWGLTIEQVAALIDILQGGTAEVRRVHEQAVREQVARDIREMAVAYAGGSDGYKALLRAARRAEGWPT